MQWWTPFTLVLVLMRSPLSASLCILCSGLVHLLLTWHGVISSFCTAPRLKNSGWQAWLTLKVPDSQRLFRKQIHVVRTSCATICWPIVSVCSSARPPAPLLTLDWAIVWLQTCRGRSVFLVPVTAALFQWILGNIKLTSLVMWISFGFLEKGPGPFSQDP